MGSSASKEANMSQESTAEPHKKLDLDSHAIGDVEETPRNITPSFPFLKLPLELRLEVYLFSLSRHEADFILYLCWISDSSFNPPTDRFFHPHIYLRHRATVRSAMARNVQGLQDPDIRGFFGLMETCRQIRTELSQLFWSRTELSVVLTNNLISLARGPEAMLSSLGHQVANGYLGLAQTVIVILRPAVYGQRGRRLRAPRAQATFQTAFEDTRDTFRTLLKNLPRLRHLKVHLSNTSVTDNLENDGMVEAVVAVLKQFSNLKSVELHGQFTTSVVKNWKQQLDIDISFVTLSNSWKLRALPVDLYNYARLARCEGRSESRHKIQDATDSLQT